MGLQDRDYYRYQSSSNVRGGFLVGLTPVVKWLLILNVGVFVHTSKHIRLKELHGLRILFRALFSFLKR